MDTTQWAQGIGLIRKPIEDELLVPSSIITAAATNNNTVNNSGGSARGVVPGVLPQQQLVERKARPQKEQALHCPRCNSTNTKFCYYNNYSLTQPRYFCKTCRRYWTEGGSLRNVPVGGGSRKNKRHGSSASHNSSTSTTSQPPSAVKNSLNAPHQIAPTSSSLPTASQSSNQAFDPVQDLNLGFPGHSFLNLESSGGGGLSAMELLRSSGITARGLGPMVPMQMTMQPPPQPQSGVLHGAGAFPFDGNMPEAGRRLLFPFGDHMKQEQHRGQGGDQPPVFWNGMMGGGGGGAGNGSW